MIHRNSTRLVAHAMPANDNNNNGNNGNNSNVNRIYVMDDEINVLSMKNFRQHEPPSLWKRLGGATTLTMTLLGLVIGFLMGFDQAANHVQPQQLQTTIVTESSDGALVRYSSMTSPMELLGLLRKTRLSLIQKLHDEYGDYAHVLMDKGNLNKVFHLSSGSKSRYHRRIIQKILQKQLSPKQDVTFTWVTAGDVHAAGFGNDPGHSYTSMLDDTARRAFSAVGLELVARNHGIYNVPSAPALALCMTSVFGADIDVLSWDFGLADSEYRYRAALFAMRATMHPTRPLLLMVDTRDDDRWKKFFWTEGKVGVGLMDTKSIQEVVQQHFPDSSLVTHPEQLPPALSYLHCQGAIEGQCNAPTKHADCEANDAGAKCRKHKFLTSDSCDMSRYQSDWNHGWKDHRLKGRLLGLFLIQLLQDALLELDEAAQEMMHLPLNERREAILKQYQQYDGQDNFVMSNSVVSSNIVGRYSDRMADLTIPLFQRPSTCLLPRAAHAEESGGHEIRTGRLRRRLQGGVAAMHPEPIAAEQGAPANQTVDAVVVGATQQQQAEAVAAPPAQEVVVEQGEAPPANETVGSEQIIVGDAESAPGAADAGVADSQKEKVDAAAAPATETTPAQDSQIAVSGIGGIVAGPEPKKTVVVVADAAQGNATVSGAEARVPVPVVDIQADDAAAAASAGPDGEVVVVVVADAAAANDETPLPKPGPASQKATLHALLEGQQAAAPENPEATAAAAASSLAKEESKSQVVEADSPAGEESTGIVESAVPAAEAQVAVEVQADETAAENVTAEADAPAEATTVNAQGAARQGSAFEERAEDGDGPAAAGESCPKLGFAKKDALAEIAGGEDGGFGVEIDVKGDAFLVACFRSCTAGNCVRPLDGLDSVKIADGNIAIEVDGRRVSGSREIDSCHFLESPEYGFLWKSKHDKFQIRFRVKEAGSDVLLYSVLAL